MCSASIPASETSVPPTCQVDTVLNAVSMELTHSAKRCNEIQWVISELLERAHHPNLSAELHILQDIDRIHQTLEDLARILSAIAHPTQGVSCAENELSQALTLDSLRARLFQSREFSEDASNCSENPDEITWL